MNEEDLERLRFHRRRTHFSIKLMNAPSATALPPVGPCLGIIILRRQARQAVAQSARDGNENNLLGVEADPRVIAVGVCTWMRQKGWPFYYVHGMAGWLVAI